MGWSSSSPEVVGKCPVDTIHSSGDIVRRYFGRIDTEMTRENSLFGISKVQIDKTVSFTSINGDSGR